MQAKRGQNMLVDAYHVGFEEKEGFCTAHLSLSHPCNNLHSDTQASTNNNNSKHQYLNQRFSRASLVHP